ncbi:predicted protein [Thalassiosira pseudonana CCMP1335]|uniref:Uncharacterized protein n=1 Tax=Thalassiosira pseudonana TaxID=35128 RepID=B8BYG8_THAPS|nr:predicted protein [Thalassiosira pseudonana CCMP1335]EED94374.1 predicted protein [Thalassiosira pseudonana CCMP1335]
MTRAGGKRTNGSTSKACKNSQSQSQESTIDSIMERFSKAKELEADIDILQTEHKTKRKPSTSSEEKLSALRLKLCELFSDLILTDPIIAMSQNAIDRIWKYCFYGRINEIRSRITKEKSRAKMRLLDGGGRGEIVSSTASTVSNNGVEDFEKQLAQFLKEAVALYEYLIGKYVKMLMPVSSQASSVLSQDEQEETTRAIISSLYRMHIHLGDLNRYGSTYKQAEECYLKAAQISPGNGNPFNQLAVVAQSQETLTAVALYYYARSLMASNQPFETSRPNLVRLFEANHKWLKDHGRNGDSHSRGLVSVNIEGSNMGKKAQKEWLHKERTVLNRKALAKMVDLQWAFFRGVSLDGADDKIDLNELMEKMTLLLDTFTSLLSHASFSESLLCKIVAILAFSTLGASNGGKLCSAKQLVSNREKDPQWNEGVIIANQALAFSFLLQFCTMLATHITTSLEKKESGGGGSKGLGTIRSLSPLLLGVNFAMSIYNGSQWFHGLPFFSSEDLHLDSNPVRELCVTSQTTFWESIANVVNSLSKYSPNGKSSAEYASVKDFEEMYCYVPFASFLKREDLVKDHDVKSKYASLEEVVTILSGTKSSSGFKPGEAETLSKVRLLLSVAEEASNNANGQTFLVKDVDTNVWRAFGESNASTLSDDGVDNTNMDDNNTGNDMEEVVPLKTPFSGLNVPLLTPAALLGGDAFNAPSGNNASPDFSASVPFASMLSNTAKREHSNERQRIAQTIDAPTQTPISTLITQQKPTLPPPPGFSAPRQPSLSFLPNPNIVGLQPNNGRVASNLWQGSLPLGTVLRSQAGHSIIETLNPFGQSPSYFTNVSNVAMLSNATNSHWNNPNYPNLDFAMNNGGLQSTDELASSNAVGMLVPSMESNQNEQHESLLKFLFESNDAEGSTTHQWIKQSPPGFPQTQNPFVGGRKY